MDVVLTQFTGFDVNAVEKPEPELFFDHLIIPKLKFSIHGCIQHGEKEQL